MGLLEKLKSVFGSRNERGSAPDAGEAEVTVEYEPAAESEHAVKGTGEIDEQEAGEPAADEDTEATEPAEETDEAGTAEADTAAESPPVDEIRGVGPTYSERLSGVGVETVADLAAADAETVAEAAGASVSRAEDWIERARNRT
jgi:predicted flap endonuclease-1-like 5' DNA nuclease